jgi:cytochrome P460
MRKTLSAAYAAYAVLVSISTASAMGMDYHANGYDIVVDEDGGIHMPDVDFRTEWTALGTFSIAGEEEAEGLHVVYTQPGVAQHFRATGMFPDGAVVIKELLSTKTEDLTTGTVSYAAERSGWFVMVKDAKNRFEENDLWGHGWGWAYFDVADPTTPVTTSYKAECMACHVPAQATDWIYTRGYPVLESR